MQETVPASFHKMNLPAIGIGVMVAPAIGGVLTGAQGYGAILWAGGGAVLIALIISLAALRLGLPLARAEREQAGRELLDPEPLL